MKIINDKLSRSKNIKLNVILSSLLKLGGMAISFIVVPMTLSFLGELQYGVWATILSILSWISFFDIGLGNGLRNNLTQAITDKDYKKSRQYIATTYFTISLIVLILIFISLIIIPILNWNNIFKINLGVKSNLSKVMLITVIFALINFIMTIYNQMFYAIQKSAYTGIGQLINNLIILSLMVVVSRFTKGNLILMSYIYGSATIITSITLTYIFFKNNKKLIPKLYDINFDKIKEITNIGLKFFIIQISAMIIFTTDNMIITQILGVEYVTPYSIAQKFFSVINIGFGIIMAPLWSAYTEAFHLKDFKWIINVIIKLNKLFFGAIITCVIMIIISPIVFKVWIGDKVVISTSLLVLMGIYTLISIWNNIYVFFLNGISKVKCSMYVSIVGAIINIPLSIIFANYMGLSGIMLATIFSLSLAAFQAPIETYIILRKKSKEKINNERTDG